MIERDPAVSLEVLAKPALSGRRPSAPSARRYIARQSEVVRYKLWKSAPLAMNYLADVVAKRTAFDEGCYKAAISILDRCVPRITSQTVEQTSVSLTFTAEDIAEELRQRLQRVGMVPEGEP